MSNKLAELQNKYDASKEKEQKLQQTLERHLKQAGKKVDELHKKGVPVDLENLQHCEIFKYDANHNSTEHYWALCDLQHKGEDIHNTKIKIKKQKEVTKKHYERLFAEQQKQADISFGVPPIILQFMEIWKSRVIEHLKKHYQNSIGYDAQLDRDQIEAYVTYGKTAPEYQQYFTPEGVLKITLREVERWNSKGLNTYLESHNLSYFQVRQRKNTYAGAMVNKLKTMYNEEERWRWLEKTIEEDKQARIHKLVTSVREITGDITDASALRIGANGDLNGFVIGNNGVADVKTVGAGGYNIQVYHFRTLIHPIK